MTETAALSNLVAWGIQVTLLVAASACLPVLLRVHSPSIRYAWWRTVLLACLVLPAVQPWQIVPVADIEVPDLQRMTHIPETAISTAAPARAVSLVAGSSGPIIAAVLPIVLVGGVAVRLGWLLIGLMRLRRLRAAGRRAEPNEGNRELAALTEAGAEIRYVPVIGQPVTFGLRHPVVLLPASMTKLPVQIQRAVLAHELWHVRRRDWLWILAEEIVLAVLWFHPAIWYLISRIQSSREEVVDELTVMLTNARRTYIEALLAFADEPPLFAAAPFARRRHLFQRMLLISKEAVMSSKRIVASSAAMAAALAITGWFGVNAFPLTTPSSGTSNEALSPAISSKNPTGAAATSAAGQSGAAQQSPPRDFRPGQPGPPSNKEIELQKAIAAGSTMSAALYIELAKMQEQRRAISEAESTLLAGRNASADPSIARALAGFYLRTNRFDEAVKTIEGLAAADPTNAPAQLVVATYYFEKAQKDQTLTPAQKSEYIKAGVAAADRALAQDADYAEAMTYKSILLRMQAQIETDRVTREQLLAEADTLRNRAMELTKARGGASGGVPGGVAGGVAGGIGTPPPPPPPPPGQEPITIDGQEPLKVGGNIKPPRKLKDVRPVYPEEAKAQGITGVVIIEAGIDSAGTVRTTRVLRSIPGLNEAALEAVKQWEFEPTQLNGMPVPVLMTVTVNFTTDAGGGVAGAGSQPPPPPPPAPPQQTMEVDGQAPVRVGGNIAPPRKLKDVRPVYPDDARAAGVTGVVILEAVIDSLGLVRTTKVLRSISMLDKAAMDAVQQWEFEPTHLNGVPVPVIMTVTVNFTMQ